MVQSHTIFWLQQILSHGCWPLRSAGRRAHLTVPRLCKNYLPQRGHCFDCHLKAHTPPCCLPEKMDHLTEFELGNDYRWSCAGRLESVIMSLVEKGWWAAGGNARAVTLSWDELWSKHIWSCFTGVPPSATCRAWVGLHSQQRSTTQCWAPVLTAQD